MRVLLLGGTAEARTLAAALVDDGHDVATSLAGRVSDPRLPGAGAVRIGGFGGVEGLRAVAAAYDVVVDATHPFAATISAHAAQACGATPLLRLQRPGWASHPHARRWTWVEDPAAAAGAAARYRRPFLTIGRQSLPLFVRALADHAVLARVVEDVAVPPAWTLLRSRGPYMVAGETELMRRHGADVLVTKDSGGDLTSAKLDAAAALGVPVVAVRRPPLPAGMPVVEDVAAARRWVRSQA